MIEITYTDFLREKLPSLMRMANLASHDLVKIEEAFQAHQASTVESEEIPTTLFDLAIIYPADHSKMLFDFGCLIGERIESKLPVEMHHELKETIRRFVGTDDVSNGYLTGLGELSVLDELLRMPFIAVEEIEAPLPNKKCADFRVVNNCQRHYIEVVTTRFRLDRIKSDKDVEDFFFGRAEQKLLDKTKDLPHETRVLLFPVIFGADDVGGLLKFQTGLENASARMESIGAFWPLLIGAFSHDGKQWQYESHPIQHLFKQHEH
jgi:hypothetical protein